MRGEGGLLTNDSLPYFVHLEGEGERENERERSNNKRSYLIAFLSRACFTMGCKFLYLLDRLFRTHKGSQEGGGVVLNNNIKVSHA